MRGADWRELPRKQLRSSLTKQWRERAYRHSWLANDCRPAITSCPPYHAMAPIEPKPRNIIRDANDELYTPIGLMHRASPVTPLRLCCILVYVGHSVFRGDDYGTVHQSWQHNRDTWGRLVEQQYGRRRTVLPLSSLVLGILLWYANCLLKFL